MEAYASNLVHLFIFLLFFSFNKFYYVQLLCLLVQDMRRDLGISHFEGKMEVKDMEVNTLDKN